MTRALEHSNPSRLLILMIQIEWCNSIDCIYSTEFISFLRLRTIFPMEIIVIDDAFTPRHLKVVAKHHKCSYQSLK